MMIRCNLSTLMGGDVVQQQIFIRKPIGQKNYK